MEVGAGGAPGGTGEGDHIPGLHRLAHPRQQLGVVAIQGRQTTAVVDHHIVAVAALVVGGHGHGPRQGGADGGSGRHRQIHSTVTPPFAGERVAAVAELRGDHVPPVLPDGGAEAVRADEGHIRPGEAAAAARRSISNQVIDAVGVAPLLSSRRHTHGGDILPYGSQILDGDGGRIGLLCLLRRIAALHENRADTLLPGDKAVRKGLSVPMASGAEVQSIKNRLDADIIKASIEALIVAVNKLDEIKTSDVCKDARMIEIMNYIQANYIDVTLDDLSEKFYLSKPYLSKYIREKSGMTFGELVKKVRMKKARAMLKSSSMTVENIALTVGYQNVEHFNRLFKKAYDMTPVQFRNQK